MPHTPAYASICVNQKINIQEIHIATTQLHAFTHTIEFHNGKHLLADVHTHSDTLTVGGAAAAGQLPPPRLGPCLAPCRASSPKQNHTTHTHKDNRKDGAVQFH